MAYFKIKSYHFSEDLSLNTVRNCTTAHVVKSEGSSTALTLLVPSRMLRIWETRDTGKPIYHGLSI